MLPIFLCRPSPTSCTLAPPCAAIPSLLVGRSEQCSKQSATVVLASLSHSAREVFRLIAETQMDPAGEQGQLFWVVAVPSVCLQACMWLCMLLLGASIWFRSCFARSASSTSQCLSCRCLGKCASLRGTAGIAFPRLFQRCRERFLVSNEMLLRSFLTEFRDHELLQTK